MWRKNNPRFDPGLPSDDLIDFRHVSMGANPVSGDRFIAFGIVEFQIRFSPRPGDTGLGIDDDRIVFDQPHL